ncbi:MAG: (Fe-S)-binding protein [Geobacteraceae bacterium]|nr:(Fe-S)-binding protein [Geobacteraceae bacterium]
MATNDCAAAMADMVAACTSCGECVRPCSFLQQQGTPAAIARRGNAESTLLSAFGCSLCGLCDAVCPEGLSPSAMFMAMRQEAVRNGLIDLKPYAPWLHYEKLGASPLFQRDLFPAGCTTVFFPGCSLPGTRPDTVQGLYRLLRTYDPAIGLVLDCCGKISHDLGLYERFTTIFKRLSTRLVNKGITRILTACPGCSKILRKYGEQFEVVSVYEVLVSSVPLPDAQNQNRLVTIHDPCPARFDQPQQQAVRQLINQCGYQVEELPSHGQTTRCCGQGGMVEGCVPGTVKQESSIIAAEAAGRPVVSSCGACCETLASTTPTAHIADLLTGTGNFTAQPVSSLKRWLNRLKLRFSRLS